MSGGTNSVVSGGSTSIPSVQESVRANPKGGASGFTSALAEKKGIAGTDPQAALASLGKITQAGELPFSQRLEAFRVIVSQIIASPTNPYSKIESDARNEMIESIAGVLADSPIALPRRRVSKIA